MNNTNRVYVVDNFYEDIQSVIDMAICDQPSPCPGMRSKSVINIDTSFYKKFREKIFQIHGIADDGKYGFSTY